MNEGLGELRVSQTLFYCGRSLTAVFAEDALLGKIKASPLGCMDNLRQNDWFGFFWRLRFYRLPLQLFVLGQRLYGAAFHGAFVGQETNAGPVGRIDIGGEGSSVFQNAGNELMDQMRMGTPYRSVPENSSFCRLIQNRLPAGWTNTAPALCILLPGAPVSMPLSISTLRRSGCPCTGLSPILPIASRCCVICAATPFPLMQTSSS